MIQSYGYTHDNLADPREILVRQNFIYGMRAMRHAGRKKMYIQLDLTKLPGHP